MAAEKRGRMRREQPRPTSEAREAAEVTGRVPRHKYRFQHGQRMENTIRYKDTLQPGHLEYRYRVNCKLSGVGMR